MDCHTHSFKDRKGNDFILKFFGQKALFKTFMKFNSDALLPLVNELKDNKAKSKRLPFKQGKVELEYTLDSNVLTIHNVSSNSTQKTSSKKNTGKKQRFDSLLANVYKEIQFEDELRQVLKDDLVSRGLPGSMLDHIQDGF